MNFEAPSPALVELATRHQVSTDFWDWKGAHVPASAETLRAVLAGLGVDTCDGDDQAALDRDRLAREAAHWARPLPSIVVLREGSAPSVLVHLGHGSTFSAELMLESGEIRPVRQIEHNAEPREVDGVLVGEAAVELDDDLPLGWHTLVVRFAEPSTGGAESASVPVVVAPQRLDLPHGLDDRPGWGPMTQLYQVRSADSWGVGDLGDLATLTRWAGRDLGADFVLVNPLHAAEPVAPMEPSPYLPTTRRFANPLYLQVEALPEYAAASAAIRDLVDDLAASTRKLNNEDVIDRDRSWEVKRVALRALFDAASPVTDPEFVEYSRRQGSGLTEFSLWCALAEVHGAEASAWPAALRERDPEALAAFSAGHVDDLAFHAWLQWRIACQLAQVQRDAVASGMRLGVIHDLAVGVHPDGADAWLLPHALAQGVTVGAPPDQFNQRGQDWSQPPWHPERLADLAYAPYVAMVRALLADAGGLRIDHIIGLFRLWWVPQGRSPQDGTYVRYDHETLISILMLEAARAGAVLIGEDLGVVEPAARDYLRERGLLGTSIVWFEWADGQPVPPEDYRALALATVTTHDLPPTMGYLELAHVELRQRLGLLTRPVEEERAQERATIDTVRQFLIRRGDLAPEDAQDERAVVIALHRCLAATPSRLRGVSLSDMVGDKRIINQPGTDEEYPNWRVPLADGAGRPLLLSAAVDDPLGHELAAVLSTRPH